MATFDETVEKLNQTTEKLDKAIDKMNAPDPLDKEDASEAETRREEDKDRKTNNEYLRVIADGISNSGTTVKVDGKKGGFGLIGGLLSGIGSAVAGVGLMILGPAMVGLAAGFTALGLASKMITLAGLAIGGFIASVGTGTWIFGQGAKAFGQGLKDTAAGVEELDRVGKKIDNKNLIAVGDGLKKFLESTASMKSFFGSVITFLTGDLPKIADGLEKFNKLDIDKQKMTDAGQGLNAFMSAMGEGSFFGKLMGSISTVIVPDLKNLADGVGKLSDVSKGLDLQKFLDMATGIGELNDPLLRLSKTGFTTNFVGKGALSDIADGVTALNKTEVNRLKEVSTAMGNLDENMFEIVKTGFVANFVGKGALKDISDGVTHVNKTEVDRLGTVATGLTSIIDPLKSMTLIGFGANFVGKGAIKDIADGAKHLATQLGTQEILNQSLLAAKSMGVMKESLSTFTSGNLWNSLKGVGESLLNFISGSNSPIEKIAEVARNSTDLEKGANAIDKIGTGLEKLSKMNFDGRTFKLAEFAEDLKNSIPDIEAAINGGEIGGTMGFAKTTIKGLGSTDLKLDTAVANVAKLKSVMGSLSPTPVAVTPSGSGGGNDLWQSKLLKTLDTLSSQMGGGATVLNQVNKGGDSVVTTNNTQMPSLSLNNPQGPSPMR
jgi:hypothetical protein